MNEPIPMGCKAYEAVSRWFDARCRALAAEGRRDAARALCDEWGVFLKSFEPKCSLDPAEVAAVAGSVVMP